MFSKGLSAQVIRTGQSVLLAHVNLDQLVQENALSGADESFLREHLRAHSMVALPLIAGNRVLGNTNNWG